MIPEQAWALVPNDLPPHLEGWVTRLADAAEFSERERRAYAWAMHLLSRLSGQSVVTAIMGLAAERAMAYPEILDITAGFIPFSSKSTDSAKAPRDARMDYEAPIATTGDVNYTFGIVIGITPPPSAPQLEEAPASLSQVVSIDNFPIVVEFRQILESAPPHPIGATSTCYARPRTSKRFFGPAWSSGIVIARHVLSNLGFSLGVSVPMASGTSFLVADIDASTTIDAAILDCLAIPRHASPLLLAPAVAPGNNVDVRRAAGVFTAQVLRINDHPSYFGNMVAHRLFLDTLGSTSDSGSLVSRTPSSDSAGLYIGSTGGPVPEGLVQSMRQVVQYFDVDLFD